MKKSELIITIIIMLLIGATTVYAAEPKVTIQGAATVKTGETQKVTVAVTSDEKIGVVSGTVQVEGDITIKNVSGKNSWTLIYNNATGTFNILKAEGAENEQVMEIEYTAGEEEGTGSIKINEVNLTTIEYETKEIGTVSKAIQIIKEDTDQPEDNEDKENGEPENKEDQEGGEQEDKELSKIEVAKKPSKTTYIKGEKFDKTGMTILAKYTDGTSKEITNYTYSPAGVLKVTDKKVTVTYTEEGVTKTATVEIKVNEIGNTGGNTTGGSTSGNGTSGGSANRNDSTVADKNLSDTGLGTMILPIVLVIILGTIGFIGYKRYNKI